MSALIKFVDAYAERPFEELDDAAMAGGSLYLTLSIGPAGEEGGHLFDVTVMSLEKLAEVVDLEGHAWGRHHLFLERLSVDAIRGRLDALIAACEAGDFWETAKKLSAYLQWEYEDYQA